MSKGAIVFLCLVAVGCSARSPALSGASLNGIRLSDRAAAAFERGEYDEALQIYKRVLGLSRLEEDYAGVAASLMNIAIVYRKLGQADTARQYLVEMLPPEPGPYTPSQRSQAAFLEGLLYLEKNDLSHAEEWAVKALALCQQSQCAMAGRLHNLQGRIALAQGKPELAIAAAATAVEVNRDERDVVEEANSLRLAADARTLMHQYEMARALYESAYRLDKSLDNSAKVTRDLLGVGRTYHREGNFADALEYYRRARAVCENVGDEEGAQAAARLIREVQMDGRGE
jgi:tetratricopeptide (TPR) repeat protein